MAERDLMFRVYTTDQLRELWDQADDTPGETANGFYKGELALEISARVLVEQRAMLAKQQEAIQVQLPEIGGEVVVQPTHQPPLIPELLIPRPNPGDLSGRESPTGQPLYEPDSWGDVVGGGK